MLGIVKPPSDDKPIDRKKRRLLARRRQLPPETREEERKQRDEEREKAREEREKSREDRRASSFDTGSSRLRSDRGTSRQDRMGSRRSRDSRTRRGDRDDTYGESEASTRRQEREEREKEREARLAKLRAATQITTLDDIYEEMDEILALVDDFYQLADKRDEAMLSNLIKKMDEQDQDVGVLVAGGYHSSGLTQMLKERDLSYITITPQNVVIGCKLFTHTKIAKIKPNQIGKNELKLFKITYRNIIEYMKLKGTIQ